jgi:hypothetical protein
MGQHSTLEQPPAYHTKRTSKSGVQVGSWDSIGPGAYLGAWMPQRPCSCCCRPHAALLHDSPDRSSATNEVRVVTVDEVVLTVNQLCREQAGASCRQPSSKSAASQRGTCCAEMLIHTTSVHPIPTSDHTICWVSIAMDEIQHHRCQRPLQCWKPTCSMCPRADD